MRNKIRQTVCDIIDLICVILMCAIAYRINDTHPNCSLVMFCVCAYMTYKQVLPLKTDEDIED